MLFYCHSELVEESLPLGAPYRGAVEALAETEGFQSALRNPFPLTTFGYFPFQGQQGVAHPSGHPTPLPAATYCVRGKHIHNCTVPKKFFPKISEKSQKFLSKTLDENMAKC